MLEHVRDDVWLQVISGGTDFAAAIVEGRDPEPSFAEGLAVQRVLEAVEQSAAHEARWTKL